MSPNTSSGRALSAPFNAYAFRPQPEIVITTDPSMAIRFTLHRAPQCRRRWLRGHDTLFYRNCSSRATSICAAIPPNQPRSIPRVLCLRRGIRRYDVGLKRGTQGNTHGQGRARQDVLPAAPMGVTHALRGSPWTATLGLREAGKRSAMGSRRPGKCVFPWAPCSGLRSCPAYYSASGWPHDVQPRLAIIWDP
jgi:hypothetical protein